MFSKCDSAAMTCSLVFSAGEMVAGLAMATVGSWRDSLSIAAFVFSMTAHVILLVDNKLLLVNNIIQKTTNILQIEWTE